ncbi:MAG: transketolase, partial [Elusimicrobia bacterium CG_4_10_14_0_8_um_filter_37_32]
GPDGATHQSLEDIALTRVLPNLTVIEPCDVIEARKATLSSAEIYGPVYIRLVREKTAIVTAEDSPFTIGKANVLRNGKDVTVIACGPEVAEALLAAEEAEKEGIKVGVVNLHTIKPLDEETIVKVAKETGAIVTTEIHQVACGMGSAVAEILSRTYPVPIEMIGVKDRFGESGQPYELLEKFGLTSTSILNAIKRVLKRKT